MYAVGTDHAIWHSTWTATGGWGVWTAMNDTGRAGDASLSVTRRNDGSGSMDLFTRGPDGAPWHEWITANSTVIHIWEPAGTSGHVLGAPVGTWNGTTNHLDMYAVGTDHAIWHNTWTPSSWGVWTTMNDTGRAG